MKPEKPNQKPAPAQPVPAPATTPAPPAPVAQQKPSRITAERALFQSFLKTDDPGAMIQARLLRLEEHVLMNQAQVEDHVLFMAARAERIARQDAELAERKLQIDAALASNQAIHDAMKTEFGQHVSRKRR